jgi:NADH:flavin oxidoreductase/NADH oxidase family protein
MYIQLWHTGAMSHPDFFAGTLPISASAVNPEQVSVTPSGRQPTVTLRPMTKGEIRQTVADFGIAAKNALEAGFDGVQIQANYLYLIAQFLNSGTNLRTDKYGGSIESGLYTVNLLGHDPVELKGRRARHSKQSARDLWPGNKVLDVLQCLTSSTAPVTGNHETRRMAHATRGCATRS